MFSAWKFNGERLAGPHAAVGKTIATVVEDWGHGLGLRFTDGTWFYVQAVDEGFSESEPAIRWDRPFEEPSEALELGVIDQAEYERLEAERKAWQETCDRAKLAELKRRLGEV